MCVFLISLLVLFGNSFKAQQLDSLTLDTLQAYTDLKFALQEPDKVIKLKLKKNRLKIFPLEILRFKNLQYLDLSKNSIETIPSGIDSLQALQVLILSKNDIETLPNEIGNLKNLRILNVNQNELTALPPQIGDLGNLEYLDLWSNNIIDFPDRIVQLEKLKVLDLRVILIEDEVQQHIQSLLPHTKIYFSPGCRCKTQ